MFESWPGEMQNARTTSRAFECTEGEDRESGEGTLRMHEARTALRYSSGFLNFDILNA
jgi:hypothetical protein